MNEQPYPTTQGGQSPTYGFQSQPQPEYIGFLKQILASLMDPRTQALLAPGMALTRAPQAAWNATRIMPNIASERGNWNPFGWLARPNSMDPRPELNMSVPLSHMREQMPGVPSTREFVDHVGDVNRLGKILDYGDKAVRMTPESRAAYLKQIEGVNPQLGRDAENAAQGMRRLQAEDVRMYGQSGQEGAVPPEMMRRIFGY